jgi:hypothetical protein
MNEDDWLSFYAAAREIEQQSDVSSAVARKQLRQACGDQLIATMKAPWDEPAGRLPFEYWERIAPREWCERQVD